MDEILKFIIENRIQVSVFSWGVIGLFTWTCFQYLEYKSCKEAPEMWGKRKIYELELTQTFWIPLAIIAGPLPYAFGILFPFIDSLINWIKERRIILFRIKFPRKKDNGKFS
ncbi:hypothetical protein [Leptospira licerasiae]|uniref:Phage protein n=1 Tax=Leptospira licerasiae str. MMD4847 TaxID=1049971 RepID=A0ABN0HDK1_9LEPT|nr:hypothetical protein [Leptospira licerasiae]EIE02998.1 hypothetical protein LEP1GSC185_0973 [Leptospira licerasiae serovar Varillal str. VAR 010]EJZ43671.1 hypothetical protein LEP1GSC178_3571 [Leptospira licerasiae str. MMD4847]